MNLLVVDSDRNLVEMLTGWLKTLGHEVSRAYSGEQARMEWEERKPDLVIIDTVLGNTNVLALCQDMRHMHDALVLVVTDGNNVQDEIRCLEAGIDDYLRKPFFPGQLLARINAISRRGRSTLSQRPSSIIKNAHNVCTHEQIVSHVWGLGSGGDTYLIKAHIHHLRMKIEPDPANPINLVTVPGIGYTLIRRSIEESETDTAQVLRPVFTSQAR